MVGRLRVPRSVKSLYSKAAELGTRRTVNYCPWSEEQETKFVHSVKSGHTDEEIQVELGGTRALKSIRSKRLTMGLPSHRQQIKLMKAEKEND